MPVRAGGFILRDLGINCENFNPGILYVSKRRFDAKSIVNQHAHDFTSIIYILSGECLYNLNDKIYPVKKGNLVICNPGVPHFRKINTEAEVIEFHAGFNNIDIQNLPHGFLIHEDSKPVISMMKYEQEFFKCCSEILVEQEKNGPGSFLMLKAMIMKLIVLILKETHVSNNPDEISSINFESYDRTGIVSAIVDYLGGNYMKQISLDKISRKMFLTPAYISKVFKEETGESPINYLIKIRLSKACEMLRKSRLSIKEVSKNAGYEDAYYFSKLFKKYYGLPPSKYRSGSRPKT